MKNSIVKILGSIVLVCVFFCSPSMSQEIEIGDTGILFDLSSFWEPASCDVFGVRRFVSPSGKMEAFSFALSGDIDYDGAVGEIRKIQQEHSIDDSYIEEIPIRKSCISDLFLREVRFSRLLCDETPYYHGFVLGSGPEPFCPLALVVVVTEGRRFIDATDIFLDMEQSFYYKEEFPNYFSCASKRTAQFEIGNSGIFFSTPETWEFASCDIPGAERIVSPSGKIEVLSFTFSDSSGYARAVCEIKCIQRQIAPEKKTYVEETMTRRENVDGISVQRVCFRGPLREEDPYFCGFLFSKFPDETHPLALVVFMTNHERRVDNRDTFEDIEDSFKRIGHSFFLKQWGNF